jgi:hypothetical protein
MRPGKASRQPVDRGAIQPERRESGQAAAQFLSDAPQAGCAVSAATSIREW